MDTIILPVTLATAAAAALINVWLGARIIRVRFAEKISMGDGGNATMQCRMRAQANFIEYTPIIVILIALIELALGTSGWLWLAAAAYIGARVLHPFGMDGWMLGRQIGTIVTLTTTILLAATALAIPFLSFG